MRRRFREIVEIGEIQEIHNDTNIPIEDPETHKKTLTEVWDKINQLFFYSDLSSLTEEELKTMKHRPNDEFQVNNVIYYTDDNGKIINQKSIFEPKN